MDAEGYLPVSLIASFHRVQKLTSDNVIIIEVKPTVVIYSNPFLRYWHMLIFFTQLF